MSIKVQFTRNSRPAGDTFTPPKIMIINDVHFKFERGTEAPKFRYTKDGKTVGEEQSAPENAADVGIEFHRDDKGKVTMRDSHWTDRDGNVINGIEGYIGPPEGGANDWHLEVPGGKITEIQWTLNGKSLRLRFDAPENVNDVHITPQLQTSQASFAPLDGQSHVLATLIGYLIGALGLDRGFALSPHILQVFGDAISQPLRGITQDTTKVGDVQHCKAESSVSRAGSPTLT